MLDHDADKGFSLVEVIIAMLILGIIAIALLPVLWQGVRFSTQQSAAATATRHLYGVIEDARATPTCDDLDLILADDTIPDGKGADIEISATYDPGACGNKVAVPLTLTATDESGAQLARVDARVYIP